MERPGFIRNRKRKKSSQFLWRFSVRFFRTHMHDREMNGPGPEYVDLDIYLRFVSIPIHLNPEHSNSDSDRGLLTIYTEPKRKRFICQNFIESYTNTSINRLKRVMLCALFSRDWSNRDPANARDFRNWVESWVRRQTINRSASYASSECDFKKGSLCEDEE